MNKLMLMLICSLFLLSATSCSKSDNKKEGAQKEKIKSYYTCSMHPEIREHKPGKCPICHMNLTKVEVDDDHEGHSEKKAVKKQMWRCQDYPDVLSEKEDVCPLDGTAMVKVEDNVQVEKIVAKLKLRSAQLKHFHPDFFPTTMMKMTKSVRLLGTVFQSEEKESNIPARIDGRVEKVLVKSTGSFVQVGDPVLELYSPKLITAGEEYLLARKSYERGKTKEYRELLTQAKERLLLWGMQRDQIEKWYKGKKVPRNITVYSSSTGIVRKKNATVGKYFKEGQNFFELSDLSEIWVEIDVYEQDASLIKMGQSVVMEFISMQGEKVVGNIDFISPVLDAKSRTLKVRTTIANPRGKLRPGMAADVSLKIEIEGKRLVIPRSAIIDTGKRKVVWSKVGGRTFQAKEILTGVESEGFVEVKSGLMELEEVVVEGSFLLDAQAQLFGGYEDIPSSEENKEASAASRQHQH